MSNIVDIRSVKYSKMSFEDLFWELGSKENMDQFDRDYFTYVLNNLGVQRAGQLIDNCVVVD